MQGIKLSEKSSLITKEQELVEATIKVLRQHYERSIEDLKRLEQMKKRALDDPEAYINTHLLKTLPLGDGDEDIAVECKRIKERRDFAVRNYGIHEVNWKEIHCRGVRIPEGVYSNSHIDSVQYHSIDPVLRPLGEKRRPLSEKVSNALRKYGGESASNGQRNFSQIPLSASTSIDSILGLVDSRYNSPRIPEHDEDNSYVKDGLYSATTAPHSAAKSSQQAVFLTMTMTTIKNRAMKTLNQMAKTDAALRLSQQYHSLKCFNNNYRCVYRPILFTSSQKRRLHSNTGSKQSIGKSQVAKVFDSALVKRHKILAATTPGLVDRARKADKYLRQEVSERLLDRLYDFKADYRQFTRVLDFGSGSGFFKSLVDQEDIYHEDFGVKELIQYDLDAAILERDSDNSSGNKSITNVTGEMDGVRLPFKDNEFNLIVSSMSMHWINDIPGTLSELYRVLKPNCPLLIAMPGNDTLYELRSSLILAEQERHGFIGPSRISPMMKSSDLAGLLGHSGANFQVVTVDVDELTILYPDVFELMRDLQAMGESNASILSGGQPLSKEVLLALDPVYKAMYGTQLNLDQNEGDIKGEDDLIPATYSIIYAIGWKDGENVPKPAERGSATKSLKDI
ncbi:hypothetical protein MP228_008224 [Amoeboaphelidium protococcarum]|nr:hypothetical protein MP228_008224 [Amoeboaphelidium protococcarum]